MFTRPLHLLRPAAGVAALLLVLRTAAGPAAPGLAPVAEIADEQGRRLAVGAAEAPGLFRLVSFPDGRWPAGLMPIFAVEREGRVELRRLPPRGRENFTEPLGFLLPRPDEPDAARLAGWWDIVAVDAGGSRRWLGMELAVDGERVAGRLDPHTDYRFAHLTGGVWRTNRLTLAIEYVADRYELTATWSDGRLTGTWRRTDDGDHGTWEATRAAEAPALPDPADAVPLHAWRDAEGNRRFGPAPGPPGGGWTREEPALGLVWPAR